MGDGLNRLILSSSACTNRQSSCDLILSSSHQKHHTNAPCCAWWKKQVGGMAPPVREGERLDSNPLSLIFRQQQEISARLALRGSSPRWWVNARETGCEKTGGKKKNKKKKKGVSLYNCSFLSCSFVQLESTSYNIAITFECSVELAKFLTAHRGATAIRKKQSPLDFLSSYPF